VLENVSRWCHWSICIGCHNVEKHYPVDRRTLECTAIQASSVFAQAGSSPPGSPPPLPPANSIPSCCRARRQTQWLLSLAPHQSCFPHDVIPLVLWARSITGINHNSSPGLSEAMWNYSCWLQLLRVQPVPNKGPNENLSSWGQAAKNSDKQL